MGDGGVACVPIMDNFTETLCNGGSNSNSNGKLESKPIKRTTTKRMKLKRDAFFKKDDQQQSKNESVSVSSEKVKTDKEVENGEVEQKDEVEEGELGTLKSPRREVENGELTPEISHRSEIEKGEIVEKGEVSSPSRWRKGEQPDRLEFSSGRLRSDVVARRDRDRTPEKYRKGEYEKGDFSSWRGSKDEVEKGEIFPERWHKGEALRDEYGYSKSFKADSVRERERRYDRDWSSPPGVKYSGEDVSPGRNFSRRGNNKNCKRVARWGAGQDKNYNSKVVDETPFYKNDHSHGRNQGREQSSGFRLKRHGVHSDSGERKHYDDHGGDHVSSKSRRISGGNGRGGYPEQYSRQSAEKSFKKSNPTRTPSDRVSIRQYDSSSSREAYDRHRRSPSYSERSPRDRERARYHEHNRDWTPARSPPGFRNHRRDNKNQSPSYAERSPQDRSRSSPQDRYRPHDRRDRSPSYLERSPRDRSRASSQRKTGQRSEASDDKQSDKLVEEKPAEKILNSKDSVVSPPKDHVDRNNMQNGSVEKSVSHEIHMEDQLQTPGADVMEQLASSVNEVNEEFQSMEEDMDICDTPPHVPSSVSNVNPPGKWYYLDYFGEERGPSSLCDLKALVEEGLLMSDHLVKHLDSDRWVTVENAASPLVTAKFTPIFSDTVTQLVCPPEAPGNVLVDMVDAEQTGDHQVIVDGVDASSQTPTGADDTFYFKDPSIDERVGALLEGFSVIPGRELEIVGEALQMSFDWSEWETLGCLEGFALGQTGSEEPSEQNQEQDIPRYPESEVKDAGESTSVGGIDKESGYLCSEFTEWFSTRWSCKGGDWQRNDEATQEKSFRKKVVLNDGYPVCQMPKSGYEDPRWQRKEDLYFPCQSKRLDLPSWAISWPDEKTDGIANKSTQSKSAVLRGVKGTVMPVIRINACVVKDHGAIVSESRSKLRTKDKYSSKGTKHLSSSSDLKRFRGEDASKSFNELDTVGSWKSSIVNKPKDRLCTVDDLQLHLGNWYYIDGTGHEHGPYSSTLLQKMVHDGYLKKESSVFRKLDKVWVPLTSVIEASQDNIKPNEENVARPGGASEVSLAIHGGGSSTSSLFHNLHPQFIGYTRGKLHELVMKSYKSREFAAAINEVLDPWINSRQPKKEMEKHLLSKPMNKSHHYLQKSAIENGVSLLYEDDTTSRKRRRIAIEEEEYVMAEDLPPLCSSEPSFDELCGDTLFSREENEGRDNELEGWGLLDGSILARIFHFLRADAKSLVFASLTCKHWRTAVGFYKNLSIRVDLSAMGSNCTDSVVGSIMSGYNKQVTKALILEGCTSISFTVLEELLRSFPCITCVDIRGCNQFEELIHKFPHVTWVKGHTSQGMRIVEDSDMKIRTSSKQMAEQMCSASSRSGHGSYMDESSGLKDYFDMVDRRGAANQSFRQSLYKRTKVIDARKSASALAREARMRHWAMKKAGSGYRRMEEFLVLSLKDIMKGKTSDYFAPKVAEIENRIRSGHYARHGLSSAKQDIIKMCRDAIKMKNRGDGGDMEHMITLFTKLGTCLDDKTAIDKDEMMKKLTDESSGSCGFKKYSKSVTERKYISRAGSSVSNGGSDYGYSSDREVRRNLSKTNKKLSSESESSDEFELSSEDDESDTESVSDTQSDSDVRSEGALESKGGYLSVDESFDLIPDDREWGARMTKASLVPPVTRKYEVIDHYVIVADEAEVQRKMQVSLPDDYEDKVKAQKNGLEEVDMEIPEVKEYKPRKQLGEEVIEQEVYGIDPYTHNLLLDSIKDVVDWLPAEKDVFIEDVLLRVLNRQVRHYTGSGSTPMTYPLRPVIEEVLAASKEEHDMRTAKLCESLLNAIDSRPEDNYVAYRKGLGVVCNKKEGFTVDDFVVEFLGEVYPAWKWFEKQDGIRSLQKNSKDPAPEFYNIYLERPKGDADGYDLVVVDAMHKANYASRICHSCQPNCEAKVTAVDGQYQIGIYSVRPIGFGEEITFDYNSVTESKEEYEASVCLCGSHVCRGSYLNLTGEGAFQKVLKEWHGLLDKHSLLLEACELNWVSEEDYIELGKAGLGSCLLGGLPDWLVAYSARLVRFINLERIKLPDEIIRHAAEEKKKYGAGFDVDKPEAEIQAEGVYNQRLQNLALTLDKVRYVLRCVFGDPKKAPPPLQKLSPHEMVSAVWNGEGSLVSELLDCIAPHVDDRLLLDLKSKIRAHDPSNSGNIEKDLKKSLLWLRDEVRNLPCTYKSRHDAAADLIHIYAYTKNFFKIREYKAVTSPPVYISPLDLGPKCADKLSGVTKYRKTYGENYCLGQLIYWHNQANAEPDRVLARASRGCLSLPEISSFYAKAQKPSRQRVYGPRTLRFMLARMEKQPQRAWPKDRIWCFNSSPKIFGSPMLDAVLSKSSLEREMVVWLKNRPAIFQAMWDR